MKDRASYACLKAAKEAGFTEVGIGSCGNFGASVVHIARLFGLTPHVHIPSHYHTPRIAEMERKGGIIHRAPGTYEEVVAESSRVSKERGWYDSNPGVGRNTELSLEAYATISYEIFDKLGDAPDAVAVPVGNGTTIAGVHRGFVNLKRSGKIDHLPAMIAASTTGGNPVVKFFMEGKRTIGDLRPDEITETEHNEPLVSWICLDGQEALDSLWESGGWATYIADEEMLRFSDILAREEGLWVLPASCSSLAALSYYVKEKGVEQGKSLVALLTARRGLP